ncbi:MAG: hypothetical protein R3B70_24015 [Polyangiaceae bacterium]
MEAELHDLAVGLLVDDGGLHEGRGGGGVGGGARGGVGGGAGGEAEGHVGEAEEGLAELRAGAEGGEGGVGEVEAMADAHGAGLPLRGGEGFERGGGLVEEDVGGARGGREELPEGALGATGSEVVLGDALDQRGEGGAQGLTRGLGDGALGDEIAGAGERFESGEVGGDGGRRGGLGHQTAWGCEGRCVFEIVCRGRVRGGASGGLSSKTRRAGGRLRGLGPLP